LQIFNIFGDQACEARFGWTSLFGGIYDRRVWLIGTENHLHSHLHREATHTHLHNHTDIHPAREDGGIVPEAHVHEHKHREEQHVHPTGQALIIDTNINCAMPPVRQNRTSHIDHPDMTGPVKC